MEEQIRNIEHIHEVEKNFLGSIFNPAQFNVRYYAEPVTEDFIKEKDKQFEQDTYENIVNGLESDLTNLGMELTYSARIIIGEVAMNMIFLQRIKGYFICRDLMRNKIHLKQNFVAYSQAYPSSPRKTKEISYDWIPVNEEEIHPVIEKLFPHLQKQINDGLKSLGLLPAQQIERQKLTIVKKLRQQYENMSTELSVKKEIIGNKEERKISQEQIN